MCVCVCLCVCLTERKSEKVQITLDVKRYTRVKCLVRYFQKLQPFFSSMGLSASITESVTKRLFRGIFRFDSNLIPLKRPDDFSCGTSTILLNISMCRRSIELIHCLSDSWELTLNAANSCCCNTRQISWDDDSASLWKWVM